MPIYQFFEEIKEDVLYLRTIVQAGVEGLLKSKEFFVSFHRSQVKMEKEKESLLRQLEDLQMENREIKSKLFKVLLRCR